MFKPSRILADTSVPSVGIVGLPNTDAKDDLVESAIAFIRLEEYISVWLVAR